MDTFKDKRRFLNYWKSKPCVNTLNWSKTVMTKAQHVGKDV